MDGLNKKLIHISVPLLIIHSIEEYYFGLTKIDQFTASISKYFSLTNDTTYFIGQLILFIFLAIILLLILLHKNINFGAFVVGIILIFEFVHIYPVITSRSYYPGLITGFALFVLGIWYFYKVLRIRLSS